MLQTKNSLLFQQAAEIILLGMYVHHMVIYALDGFIQIQFL